MPRIGIASAPKSRESIDVEIAHLRDLDVVGLQNRWLATFGRRAPSHVPKHLLFRILAYRLQADRLGDLDKSSRDLLDRPGTPEEAGRNAIHPKRAATTLGIGTVLGREWNKHMYRVVVQTDGFAWNGKTYASLSQVAFAITGTRWNGPRFFGLRDKAAKQVSK